MKKFRLVFYIPDKKDGSHVDDMIGNYTLLLNRIGSIATLDFERLKVLKILYSSHEELHTPNEGNFFYTTSLGRPEMYLGKSWTATMGQLGGKDRKGSGVCCRPASEVFKNPERWFYAEFEVSDFGYKQMTDMMQVELEANQGYDVKMILNFFLPLGIGEKDKWICSEFCNHHAKIGMKYTPVNYVLKRITNKLLDTMSPLLSATTLHYCGVDFYTMDGNLLLAGKK
ncbi:MAG: hypothetical protein WC356_02830 [Candidatus Micrarchaeia archaeon]|jgi:hypothetical protein